jgi:hypothetical protein
MNDDDNNNDEENLESEVSLFCGNPFYSWLPSPYIVFAGGLRSRLVV